MCSIPASETRVPGFSVGARAGVPAAFLLASPQSQARTATLVLHTGRQRGSDGSQGARECAATVVRACAHPIEGNGERSSSDLGNASERVCQGGPLFSEPATVRRLVGRVISQDLGQSRSCAAETAHARKGAEGGTSGRAEQEMRRDMRTGIGCAYSSAKPSGLLPTCRT